MTNYILKKNAQRIIKYVDLIESAHNLIFEQTKERDRQSSARMKKHYSDRIQINKETIQYLQIRINNITKTI